MTAAIDIKGWCPGARRPMPSGDGLIVRVRPHGGALTVVALRALAEAASRFGNGQIDLTRRANLQIRGVSSETLMPLWELMASLELLDDSAEAEAIRNIVINPLAGLDPAEIIDMRPVAAALELQLAADEELRALPAKFGFALDGGGRLALAALAADVRLAAFFQDQQCRIALGLGHADAVTWLGTVTFPQAAAAAVKVARGALHYSPTKRAAALSPDAITAIATELGLEASVAIAPSPSSGVTSRQRQGVIVLTDETCAVGLGAPFGHVDSDALARLAALLVASDVSEVRLSPWRTLYVAARPDVAEQLVADAAELGLIVDDADPLLRVDACSGSGCCPSTRLATREHARMLAGDIARTRFPGTLHVSGCAKGCARSAAADLVLVGEDDQYCIVRNGTAKSEPSGVLDPADIGLTSHRLFRSRESVHV
ncbi:putative precorrin-3B synthase (cobG) [Bradyrhizobium sp. ORS 375]|uniref:precorrin-3B synthase n=1 Tax=Bradyrhizobium sp. (strain ORS 375) TaxID=566679 RepID=UPI000240A1D3|nr:precorrin-3B synthase [Bradyrhizobium sp. ORS 375]CCD94015.1 putative precorrin-3B synthase (cobG) [Bradyrhizobium sp. ORS 375]